MNIFRLFVIILKEYIRKPFTYLIVISIPAIVFFLNFSQESINSHSITAGFITDSDQVKSAMNNYNGIYEFISYENENEMKRDILNNKLECGYVFCDDFIDSMLNGKKNNNITVYISSASTLHPMINETVYSCIFPELSRLGLEDYIENKSAAKEYYQEKIFTTSDITDLYKKYYTNDSTFHFNYNKEPSNYKLDTVSLLLNPVKGLVAIMILLSALTGAYSFYNSGQNLIKANILVRLVYIIVPALISLISALFSILITSKKITDRNIISIFLILLIYTSACIIFSLILTIVIKKAIVYASIIPIIIHWHSTRPLPTMWRFAKN